jgi:hypothetical protein
MSLAKSIIALGLVIVTSALLSAQAPEKKAPPSADEIRKMMAPGPEHEQLAKYAGTWDLVIKMGPQTMECTSENRMIVGGRFLEMDYASKDKKAEGQFSLGFDRRHEHYTLTAMDNFGTYPVHSQGKRVGEAGKAKLYGKDDDPMMKAMGFTKEFVHVIDFKNPDEFSIEVWFIDTRTAERKEIKAMDYSFRRKK